jgi:O-antigen/teichoic acid export membrane protein
LLCFELFGLLGLCGVNEALIIVGKSKAQGQSACLRAAIVLNCMCVACIAPIAWVVLTVWLVDFPPWFLALTTPAYLISAAFYATGQAFLAVRGSWGLFNRINLAVDAVYLGLLGAVFVVAPARNSAVMVAAVMRLGTSSLGAACCLFYALKRGWLRWRSEGASLLDRHGTRSILMRYGLRLAPTIWLNALGERADELAFSFCAAPSAFGVYAVAKSVTAPVKTASGGSSTVLLPYLAQNNLGFSTDRRLLRTLVLALMPSIGAGLATLISIPFGIVILFGPAFSASVVPAALLTTAAILASFLENGLVALKAAGRFREAAYYRAAVVTGSLFTVAAFGRLWGVLGAAAGSLAVYLSGAIALTFKLR